MKLLLAASFLCYLALARLIYLRHWRKLQKENPTHDSIYGGP
jgi:hypothetical protein